MLHFHHIRNGACIISRRVVPACIEIGLLKLPPRRGEPKAFRTGDGSTIRWAGIRLKIVLIGVAILASACITSAQSQEVVGTSFRLLDANGNTLATLAPNEYGGATLKLGKDNLGPQAIISAGTIGTSILFNGYGRSIVVSTSVAQSSIIDMSDIGGSGSRRSRVVITAPKDGNPRVELFGEDGKKIGGIP